MACRFWPQGRMFRASHHAVCLSHALQCFTPGQVVRIRRRGETCGIIPAALPDHQPQTAPEG